MSKKRPKNKQELPSTSGVKKKPCYKTKVKFEFKLLDGTKVTNKDARLKIMSDGGVSCLIREKEKWTAVKGTILSIKIYKERCKTVGKT